MNQFDEYYSAIDEIIDCLKKDLYGVSNETELIEDIAPTSYYVTGILYSKDNNENSGQTSALSSFASEMDSNNDVILEDVLTDGDECIKSANKYKPSSMGISFMVSQSVQTIDMRFCFGVYEHIFTKKDDNPNRIYHKHQRVPVLVEETIEIPKKVGIKQISFHQEQWAIDVFLAVRMIMDDGSRLITLTVANAINSPTIGNLHEQSKYCLFQCHLQITSKLPFLPVFVNKSKRTDLSDQINDLLYSNVKNYAYGHGCSVSYDSTTENIYSISSDFLPSQQILQMMPGTISDKEILSLSFWLTADRTVACQKLLSFIDEYQDWRDAKNSTIQTTDIYYEAEKELIRRIDICISRLTNAEEILRTNDIAWKCFQLMNEAMMEQRIRTKHVKADTVCWYPFQLAYILQIIPDLVNPDSTYRNTVDLLWFPTGGGKTEAYFGVAAFEIFHRRLTNRPDKDGVSVIMRYTLRLLTIQQFERASALICACEYLRQKYHLPGGEINIGLWIGSGMTPNSIAETNETLKKLKENKDARIYEGNPVQITTCPWCGKKIDTTGYNIIDGKLVIRCSDNPECAFHEKLPIYVVDEDIYRERPTLLLSTIDKFARIVWVEEAGNLFGKDALPPSLIIQDELHLISGSLGSLAGLYEIAIDYMCSRGGISPKVIASTATVHNASEQINELYNKQTIQFPPSGLTFDDSFFACIASKDDRPARTYLGLCETGNSISDLLVRVYAVLTYCKAMFLSEGIKDEVRDQFYTIVGYFNAIRDLGSSAEILESRMRTHVISLITRKFEELSQKLEIDSQKLPFSSFEELTSRKNAAQIKETLIKLETPCTDYGCYSYILASNMLSVGIDINRLGLMTVYNQPKTNAEYIQATSRVGRKNPGLVIALYNPLRTRDRSHYEQFCFYHRSFYQYVEATSVTPFSFGSLQKALHCVFIAMVRQTINKLHSNSSAVYFKRNDPDIQEIIEYIISRVQNIAPQSTEIAADLLEEAASIWEDLTKTYSDLCYYSSKTGSNCLLKSADEPGNFEFAPILNSLRNVELSSNIYLEV